MPSEIRHLLFTRAELVRALQAYFLKLGRFPGGLVLGCEPELAELNGKLRFRVLLTGTTPSSSEQTFVDEASMAAALILFCRERHIPLPARADKSLRCFAHQVGLVTTYNAGEKRVSSI